MSRALLAPAALAAALLAGCSSGAGGSVAAADAPSTDPAVLYPALQGAFSRCRNDGGPGDLDRVEVVGLQGSAITFRAYGYASTGATCAGDATLDTAQSSDGTFSLGGTVRVPDPAGAASVTAWAVDATFVTGRKTFTLAWVDTSRTPSALHIGDDSGARDGSSPALRPTTLQALDRPRRAPVSTEEPAVEGAWRRCQQGSPDRADWISFAGTAVGLRVYAAATADGACGGAQRLLSVLPLVATFGPELAISISRSVRLPARAADFFDPSLALTISGFVAVDPYPPARMLHVAFGNHLQDWTARSLPAVAYPAALAGTWRRCNFAPKAYDVAEEWEFQAGSGMDVIGAYRTYGYGTFDGSCSKGEVQTDGDVFVGELTGSAPALLRGSSVTSPALPVAAQGLDFTPLSQGGPARYTIVYVDPFAGGVALSVGEGGFTGGATPEARPSALESGAFFRQ